VKIYVTSSGIISALGTGTEDNYKAIRSGITGIQYSESQKVMLGNVQLSNEELMSLNKTVNVEFSRNVLLSTLAAREAWGQNVSMPNINDGIISGTSIGAMDLVEKYYFESLDEPNEIVDSRMVLDNGLVTESVAHLIGLKGFILTISTACSSSANAIMQGARLIEAGILDRVLVGGCDPMALFDLLGFQSLNIYDDHLCKPFDNNRKGLNLGEAAAFLIIENEHSLSKTHNKPICLLSGWSNATDAYHQTASSPNGEGASRTMTEAIKKANIKPKDIDYINAHGTGTPNNDLSESRALVNVFGESLPPFSSTKSFTGHTLAAAGAVEAVFSIQSIIDQALIPNLNFSDKMVETGINPITEYKQGVSVNHVLTNSFGFGGNCTSLVFSKIKEGL